MTYEFPELLHVDGRAYHLYAYPLDRYLSGVPDWPRYRKTPWNSRGYAATWTVEGDVLYLTQLDAPADDPLHRLFPEVRPPVPASWVDGLLHAYHGGRRHVGYPPRRIFEDEIVLEVKAGRVTRQWPLDLRQVPDQTDEEFKLSVPEFLWPARLRGMGPRRTRADSGSAASHGRPSSRQARAMLLHFCKSNRCSY